MEYCFAVQLTARRAGAIAVIRLTGVTKNVLQRVSRSPCAVSLAVGAFTRGELVSAGGEVLDDAIIVRTGEYDFELHVHGGVAVTEAVLQALRDAGAHVVPLEEATPPLLGARGEIERELELALPRATTETALQMLLAQPRAWSDWASHWRQRMSPASLWQFHSAAQWMLYRSVALTRLLNPARIAIIGPPNAGKSTLANALLGRPLSITSDVAGTTRDWVDAQAIFSAGRVQVPVTLVDTAGVRTTPDDLERESIARTHLQAAEADAIILLLDGTAARTPDELALRASFRHRPLVTALNKCDVLRVPSTSQWPALAISARTHEGLESLMSAVLMQLDVERVEFTEPFAFSNRLEDMLQGLSRCDVPLSCQRILELLISPTVARA